MAAQLFVTGHRLFLIFHSKEMSSEQSIYLQGTAKGSYMHHLVKEERLYA